MHGACPKWLHRDSQGGRRHVDWPRGLQQLDVTVIHLRLWHPIDNQCMSLMVRLFPGVTSSSAFGHTTYLCDRQAGGQASPLVGRICERYTFLFRSAGGPRPFLDNVQPPGVTVMGITRSLLVLAVYAIARGRLVSVACGLMRFSWRLWCRQQEFSVVLEAEVIFWFRYPLFLRRSWSPALVLLLVECDRRLSGR